MGIKCTDSVALFMRIFQFNDFQLTSIKRILEETIMWAYMLLTLVNFSQCNYYQAYLKPSLTECQQTIIQSELLE